MPTPRTTHRAARLRLAALSLVLAAVAVACGSTSTSPAPDAPEAAIASATGDLPAISVIDVTSGASVLLTDLAADARPTLLWMWAPH